MACLTKGYSETTNQITRLIWHSVSHYYTIVYEDGTSREDGGYCSVLDLHRIAAKIMDCAKR
jgi:hypothetical protein